MKKKLKRIILGMCLFSAVSVYAENVIYISPNNDGVQDALVVPLKISDKRYITSWSLVITDKDGKTVRTIGNKYVVP